jgi:hypothetical protein
MKLHVMQFSPTSCHFISPLSEYLPEHSPGIALPSYAMPIFAVARNGVLRDNRCNTTSFRSTILMAEKGCPGRGTSLSGERLH